MRKEIIEQAAANEDTWVNSKKSELYLEDDNDTVVKLTPQKLKYYQDLVKKGVVVKPELYEESFPCKQGVSYRVWQGANIYFWQSVPLR